MARQLARRRRRERLAGLSLAGLGVIVLIVAIFALQQPSRHSTRAGSATATPKPHTTKPVSSAGSSTPPRTSSAASTSTSTSSTPASTKLPLVVLNNTTVTGLAQQAAQRFEAGGWTVTSYGNYQNDIISTCAYYDPSVPNAREAALALQSQFPTIKRVVPKFAELPAGPIVVVLTPDYS